MSIDDERLKELREKNRLAELGGGLKRISRQHDQGKLTARERIERLLDPGTFNEMDKLVVSSSDIAGGTGDKGGRIAAPGDGVVTGYGTIGGRLVFVYSQDFTVLGGSLGKMHAAKIAKVLETATKVGAPVIGLNDSGGARIQEGVDALSGYGRIFYLNTIASGVVPQISVILGPCAGGAVYSPALTDFVFMVRGISHMFITGPQVIKAVTGEDVTQEELGGADTHARISGVVHRVADSEDECFNDIRRLLSYLPSNNMEEPPAGSPLSESAVAGGTGREDTVLSSPEERSAAGESAVFDDPGRVEESLLDVLPEESNRPYDMHRIIEATIDRGTFFELQPDYAANLITGFARLAGRVVGILANQPVVLAGCLDINASDKGARFIRFCDAFNIPIITLVDVPGFLPGTAQEYGGIIRHGAKMLHAYSEATVPKITLIVRKAYGGAYLAMCSRDLGADQVLAWPSAEVAVMGPEGAANIIYKDEIEKAADPKAALEEKIAEYRRKFANPYVPAERGYIDAVIEPQDTRPKLVNALEMAGMKREMRPAKKHGNIPL